MKILCECKSTLIRLGISPEKYIRIKNQNIPRFIPRFCIILTEVSCAIVAGVLVKQRIQYNMSEFLAVFGTLTFKLQILAIFISLLGSNKKIFELIDYLEYVINKRNFRLVLQIG